MSTGVYDFIALRDAPDSYVGQAGKFPRVKATEDGLEFADVATATPTLQEVTDEGNTTTNNITAGNLSGTNTGDQDLTPYATITSLGAVAFSDDYNDLINKPTIPTGTIDGTLTANELVYGIDSNTIGSLSVSTYPSLTELSYVKGVTSAIQAQIDSK